MAVLLTAAILTPVANAREFVSGFTMIHALVFAALIVATDPIAVVVSSRRCRRASPAVGAAGQSHDLRVRLTKMIGVPMSWRSTLMDAGALKERKA
jgi:hypothetical protein